MARGAELSYSPLPTQNLTVVTRTASGALLFSDAFNFQPHGPDCLHES